MITNTVKVSAIIQCHNKEIIEKNTGLQNKDNLEYMDKYKGE